MLKRKLKGAMIAVGVVTQLKKDIAHRSEQIRLLVQLGAGVKETAEHVRELLRLKSKLARASGETVTTGHTPPPQAKGGAPPRSSTLSRAGPRSLFELVLTVIDSDGYSHR